MQTLRPNLALRARNISLVTSSTLWSMDKQTAAYSSQSVGTSRRLNWESSNDSGMKWLTRPLILSPIKPLEPCRTTTRFFCGQLYLLDMFCIWFSKSAHPMSWLIVSLPWRMICLYGSFRAEHAITPVSHRLHHLWLECKKCLSVSVDSFIIIIEWLRATVT